MANADIAQRLLAACDAFEAGRIDIPGLQSALVGHGYALECTQQSWHSQVDQWEGALEHARFMLDEIGQAKAASQVICEIRELLGGISPK